MAGKSDMRMRYLLIAVSAQNLIIPVGRSVDDQSKRATRSDDPGLIYKFDEWRPWVDHPKIKMPIWDQRPTQDDFST